MIIMKICCNGGLQINAQDFNTIPLQGLLPVVRVRARKQMQDNLLCLVQPTAFPPIPWKKVSIKSLM